MLDDKTVFMINNLELDNFLTSPIVEYKVFKDIDNIILNNSDKLSKYVLTEKIKYRISKNNITNKFFWDNTIKKLDSSNFIDDVISDVLNISDSYIPYSRWKQDNITYVNRLFAKLEDEIEYIRGNNINDENLLNKISRTIYYLEELDINEFEYDKYVSRVKKEYYKKLENYIYNKYVKNLLEDLNLTENDLKCIKEIYSIDNTKRQKL